MLVCKSNPIFDGGTNVTATGILNLASRNSAGWHMRLGDQKPNISPHWKRSIDLPFFASNLCGTPCACYLRSATIIGENALTERPCDSKYIPKYTPRSEGNKKSKMQHYIIL